MPALLVFSASARHSREACQMNERLLTGRERSLYNFILLVFLQALLFRGTSSFLIFLFIILIFLGFMFYLCFPLGKSHLSLSLSLFIFPWRKIFPLQLFFFFINLNVLFSFAFQPPAFTLASLFTRGKILIKSRSTLPSLKCIVFRFTRGS